LFVVKKKKDKNTRERIVERSAEVEEKVDGVEGG
jgi:hypothetical protein